MNLMIDANILLDVLMDRQPHVRYSSLIWKLCETGKTNGYVSALSFADIIYIMRKQLDPTQTESLLNQLTFIFRFVDLHAADLKKAAALHWNDFEDALQAVAANRIDAQAIVTRNIKDYQSSPVPALTPEEVCRLFQ